jgi:hypothetical protein
MTSWPHLLRTCPLRWRAYSLLLIRRLSVGPRWDAMRALRSGRRRRHWRRCGRSFSGCPKAPVGRHASHDARQWPLCDRADTSQQPDRRADHDQDPTGASHQAISARRRARLGRRRARVRKTSWNKEARAAHPPRPHIDPAVTIPKHTGAPFGNPADSGSPVALRPRLATGVLVRGGHSISEWEAVWTASLVARAMLTASLLARAARPRSGRLRRIRAWICGPICAPRRLRTLTLVRVNKNARRGA